MSSWRSPWQLLLTRSLSRGSLQEKLRAVPFTRSIEEAMAAYNQHHRGYPPSRAPRLVENFLPFWAVCSHVRALINSAELGFTDFVPHFNFNTRGGEFRLSTVYKPFTWSLQDSPRLNASHDPASHLTMQICASFDYPRTYVKSIRSSNTFRGAAQLTPQTVGDAHRLGRKRGLEEFRITPSEALALAKDEIYRDVREQATVLLKTQYNADEVQSMDMNVEFLSLSVSPIYVPVFIFESSHLGETVRTFVHGSTLVAGGPTLYNARVAGVGGATIAACAAAALGELPPPEVILPHLVLPAGALGFLVAYVCPLVGLKMQKWSQAREARVQFGDGDGLWDEEYVMPFDAGKVGAAQEEAHGEKMRDEGIRAQNDRSGYMRTSLKRDPEGLYAALRLQPGASEKEIRLAFRALEVEEHPDRCLNERQKERAKLRFQKITAAYEVLRDGSR